MIYQLAERRVQIDDSCFVAPNAVILGSATIKHEASVWFGATIRADCEQIVVGEQSNIQDGAVLHSDEGIPLLIGRGVTIGHRATLHGCTVGDHCLIGIGATVLNGATIGKHSLIGAHALVVENKVIPERSLVVGVPGKVVRPLTDDEIEGLEESARHYVANAKHFLTRLRAEGAPHPSPLPARLP